LKVWSGDVQGGRDAAHDVAVAGTFFDVIVVEGDEYCDVVSVLNRHTALGNNSESRRTKVKYMGNPLYTRNLLL
jgi:hypothetical protein